MKLKKQSSDGKKLAVLFLLKSSTTIVAAALLCFTVMFVGHGARAREDAIFATLNQAKCVPERVSQLYDQPTAKVYEVACKRSKLLKYIACTSADCYELTDRTQSQYMD